MQPRGDPGWECVGMGSIGWTVYLPYLHRHPLPQCWPPPHPAGPEAPVVPCFAVCQSLGIPEHNLVLVSLE